MENNRYSPINKIVVVGNYPPRMCGIATFTQDIVKALQKAKKKPIVFSIFNQDADSCFPEEATFIINQNNSADYHSAAEIADSMNADLIYIQHEFGIYGGKDGSHILNLIENCSTPIIVHLHTILDAPSKGQREVIERMKDRVAGFIVMSQRGKQILNETYGVSSSAIQIVPHGIPDIDFLDRSFYKQSLGLSKRKTILTFGLVSPNKGLEVMLRALPQIVAEHPETTYIILGKTHPNIVKEHGEQYRDNLKLLAQKLGVEQNLRFEDRFVCLSELAQYIGACDVYVTPYPNRNQITSGTLSYAYGSGRAVVSTPYWHAEELLADGKGVLVPFNDPDETAAAICGLLSDEHRRTVIENNAYQEGRTFCWSKIGSRLDHAFNELIEDKNFSHSVIGRFLTANPQYDWNFTHLRQLTDDTGLIQHATEQMPLYSEGYCVDDNSRALIVTNDAQLTCPDADLNDLAIRYAAFINHSYDRTNSTFRNFMSYSREWMEDKGSHDSIARVLWSLAHTTAYSPDLNLRRWAANLYIDCAVPLMESDSIRAWAHSIVAGTTFLSRYPGHKPTRLMVSQLAAQMQQCYISNADQEWQWFEPYLTYDNAKLCEAMLAAGQLLGEPYLTLGFKSLDWLNEQQGERGYFRPIGSSGFYPKGGDRAVFDQQPIEAWTTASANRLAYEISGHIQYYNKVHRTIDWFYGANDIGQALVDSETGACCDGIHFTRLNRNCGAESTLAYLGTMNEFWRVATIKRMQEGRALATPSLPAETATLR